MSYPYDPNAPQEQPGAPVPPPYPSAPVPPPYAQQPPYGQQAPLPPTPSYPTYGAPGYGMPPAAPYGAAVYPKNNLGVWALVLGILSFLCLGLFAGIPAIITGHLGQQASTQGLANNRGMATAGLVLGIIGTAFSLIGWIWLGTRG